MPNSHPPSWSLEAGRELLPGLVSPFTWSVMGPSAERALRQVFEELGQPLPAEPPLWRRELGRAYANSQGMAEATETLFASTAAAPSLGQQLLGRGQERRQAAFVQGVVEQVPHQLEGIERWWERVRDTQWRQATILQVMEELEPRAEAVFQAHYQAAVGLAGLRLQLSRWLQAWLPDQADGLLADMSAELEGDAGSAGYRFHLAELLGLAEETPEVAQFLAPEQAVEWQEALPAGAFRQALEQFMATYGRFAEQPLEAAAPRWEEAPQALLAYLAAHRGQALRRLPDSPEEARRRRQEAGQRAAAALSFMRRRAFEPAFQQLQQLADLLPACRHALVTVAMAARFWALGAAMEALADGRLSDGEDVFLLELEELKQMMTGEWSNVDQVQPVVEARQSQQATWAAQEVPAVWEARG